MCGSVSGKIYHSLCFRRTHIMEVHISKAYGGPMKKSKLLASVALAGMIMGAQVAVADHHEEGAKEEQGKNSCKGKNTCKSEKEKNTCKTGKNSCKGKKAEGANACSGSNGCDGKEHPAAPEKPKAQ